jgi:hypothetical protein
MPPELGSLNPGVIFKVEDSILVCLQQPTPSMDEKIVADSKFIRSYLIKNGKIYLSLLADGDIYT